jgi:tetratricopeptide (TPR) repeat protein
MDLAIETDTFDPDSHFLFWKPGGTPRVERDGMAWRLDPGHDLVLNVHLQPSGKPEAVQPSIGLYFTDKPPAIRPMLIRLADDRALDIPPGASDFVISDDFELPLDVDVLAVYPHAHYLGKLLEAFATLPDGSRRWLIRIPRWDVNWQSVYECRERIFLPRGSVVSMQFHYDNSAANPRNPNSPPKRVMAGNQSTDEMGHLWLQVLARGEGDRRVVLQEALLRHRLGRHSDDVSARFDLGALLLGLNWPAAAIPQLREALRVVPEQPQGLNNYGAALQAEGRIDEAIGQFRHALKIQPEYLNARYNLANALLAQGKLAEAAVSLRLVLAAVPADRAARRQLSAALLRMSDDALSAGNLSTAPDLYRELVGLDPANPDLRNNLGIILTRLGDFAGAMDQFAAALKIDPSHQAARSNLEQVRTRVSKR